MAKTANEYKLLLQSLLPPGKFWTRAASSVFTQMFHGLGEELSRVETRAENLIIESDPRTSTELLIEYEKDFNIPEEGQSLGATITERQNDIYAKLIAVGQQDQGYFEDIAGALGYTVSITENVPSWAGVVKAGEELGGDDILFYWLVDIDVSNSNTDNYFQDDSDCQAVWNFDSSGLLLDSKGTNILINNNEVEQSTDYKQGDTSAFFTSADLEYLSITDTNLDSGFPLKSGETNRDISICFWVKTTTSGAYQALFSKYTVNKRSIFIVMTNINKIELGIGFANGTSTEGITHDSPILTNNWYHIGVSYNDSTREYRIRIWDSTNNKILGVDKHGFFSNQISVTTSSVNIGSFGDGAGYFFDGYLDEVVVFSKALSQNEIDLIQAASFDADKIPFSRTEKINITTLINYITKRKPGHTTALFRFTGVGYNRGLGNGFDAIPWNDNSWWELEYGRGFNNGFTNVYDYDGVRLTGGFDRQYGIGFDSHRGGGFEFNEFGDGYKKPN